MKSNEIPKEYSYPIIQQLTNSCGLASVLMILKFHPKPAIQKILEKLRDILEPLIKTIIPNSDLPQEFSDQIILEYIVLKTTNLETSKYNFLHRYLEKTFQDRYLNHNAIKIHQLNTSREKYLQDNEVDIVKQYDQFILEGGYLPPVILYDLTFENQFDMDLKILLQLWGYEFQSHEMGDGTGALYLKKEEKQVFLTLLQKGYVDQDTHIICGHNFHWMVLIGLYPDNIRRWKQKNGEIAPKTKFSEFTLVFNDPINAKKEVIPISKISGDYRFYFFHETEVSQARWYHFIEKIKEDIPHELNTITETQESPTSKKSTYQESLLSSDKDPSDVFDPF